MKFQISREYDSSKYIWENVYRKIYKDNLSFDIYCKYNGRRCVESEFRNNNEKSSKMYFSRETDFNFKKDRPNKQGKRTLCTIFFRMLEKAEAEGEIEGIREIKEMLEMCCTRNYSVENVSIMPTNGSLQIIKQSVGRDRLDTFIWCIDKHYKGESILFNHCAPEYMLQLESYLGLFNNVYDYCKCIYHIDKELTDKLIISGGQPINDIERIREYIILANNFWHQKKIYLYYGEKLDD